MPLLFEQRCERLFADVLVVTCAPATQLRRLQQRNDMSEADAKARIAAQMPMGDKEAKASIVIRNDGSKSDTIKQVFTGCGTRFSCCCTPWRAGNWDTLQSYARSMLCRVAHRHWSGACNFVALSTPAASVKQCKHRQTIHVTPSATAGAAGSG